MSALLAAAADTDRAPGPGLLVLLLTAWALWYAASCWWFPYKKCPKCKGGGRVYREDKKVFRTCPKCAGSGRRLRAGRWLWDHRPGGKGGDS